jgi:hypothetical protein
LPGRNTSLFAWSVRDVLKSFITFTTGYEIVADSHHSDDEQRHPVDACDAKAIAEIGMLCNNAENTDSNGSSGTATEKALLLLADQVLENFHFISLMLMTSML